jgi:hypothetical protein
MSDIDPVNQLNRIFLDDLREACDVLSNPEEQILHVPKGTIENLLRKIEEKGLWPSLYKVAEQHPDQWMVDLSSFFPKEEKFIEPLFKFFSISNSLHARVAFAQEADQWPWGDDTRALLPEIIGLIKSLRDQINGGDFDPVVPTLDHVIKVLKSYI